MKELQLGFRNFFRKYIQGGANENFRKLMEGGVCVYIESSNKILHITVNGKLVVYILQ